MNQLITHQEHTPRSLNNVLATPRIRYQFGFFSTSLGGLLQIALFLGMVAYIKEHSALSYFI